MTQPVMNSILILLATEAQKDKTNCWSCMHMSDVDRFQTHISLTVYGGILDSEVFWDQSMTFLTDGFAIINTLLTPDI